MINSWFASVYSTLRVFSARDLVTWDKRAHRLGSVHCREGCFPSPAETVPHGFSTDTSQIRHRKKNPGVSEPKHGWDGAHYEQILELIRDGLKITA